MMISLVIVVSFLIIFTTAALSVDTESKFLLDFYTNDLSMLIETTQALPGDITIHYPLDDNFKMALVQDKIMAFYTPKGASKEQSYHLLPNHDILPDSTTGHLVLSKKDNVIAITQQEQIQKTNCPPTVDFKAADFTVAIKTKNDLASDFTSNELQQIRQAIKLKLQKEDLLATNNPSLTIILHAKEASTINPITLSYPRGTSVQEMNYQHLICEFYQLYPSQEFSLLHQQKGEPQEQYELTITLELDEEHKKTFFEQRNTFAETLLSIVQPLQQVNS